MFIINIYKGPGVPSMFVENKLYTLVINKNLHTGYVLCTVPVMDLA